MSKLPDLASLFARHKKAVLWFSGGKDSLVCLDLCREFRGQLDVCWVNTGAAFPHMVQFIRKATEGYNFVELKSDQAAWIEQQGLPCDMVPVANSIWRHASASEPKTLLQPWTACCAKLRFQPGLDYLARSGATLLIHGQRRSDGGGFTVDSKLDARVEICKLIWGWSDDDILGYIGEHEIELPEQYADGLVDSLDCWNCPTRAGDSAAKMVARFAFTARRYPDLYEKLKLRMGKVYLATKAAFDEVKADTMQIWREDAEKFERDRAGPKCAPERGGSTSDLERNIQAYEAMEADLFKHHTNQWVVIHDRKLVGTFGTLDDAAAEALRRFGRGPYLIRQVGIANLLLPAGGTAAQSGPKPCP